MTEQSNRRGETLPPSRPTAAERARAAVAVIGPPAVAALVGWWLTDRWRDDLPDPVATHFGINGHPNGFTSVGWIPVMSVIVGVAVCVVGILAVALIRDSMAVRTAAGLCCGTAVFTVAVMVGSVAGQRNLLDAADARWNWWIPIVAGVAAIVVGWIAALAVPRWPAAPIDVGTEFIAADLSPSERFLWTRTSTSVPSIITAGIAIVVTVTAMILTRTWGLVIMLIVAIALLAFVAIRVTVDRRAVVIRSWFGWPHIRIPMADISRAEVIDVHALRDYGGWGYRLGTRGTTAGTKGFVLRSGPALVLRRNDRRGEVIVVDDAERAAGLINATLAQPGPASGSERSRSR